MVFENFLEYWYYVRSFSDRQKDIIFSSLPVEEQHNLIESCTSGKWEDVLNRNILDETIDEIKKDYGYDLIDIRYKVLNNKSVYLPTNFWEMVLEKFEDYNEEQIFFILGGIVSEVCEENKEVTLIIPSYLNCKG